MKKSLRICLFVFGLFILATSSGCRFSFIDGYSFDYGGNSAERSESGAIETTTRNIEVYNRFGDVEVIKTDQPAEWAWTGKCWASEQEDADLFLDELQMSVSLDDDKQVWRVKIPEKSSKLRGVKSHLTLKVPAGVEVKVVNAHGNFRGEGIQNSYSVENSHGNVELTRTVGQGDVKVRHGKLNGTELTGAMKIDSAHGGIQLENCSGKLQVDSQHGNVTIHDSSGSVITDVQHGKTEIDTSGSQVECKSQHGNVSIEMANQDFESVVVDSQHGDVRIDLDKNVAAEFRLTTQHGDVRNAFKDSRGESARKVWVETQHGDIRIRKQD